MTINQDNKPIIFVGDHHGEWRTLFELLEKKDIKDCCLIHLGDGGEGFLYPRQAQFDYFDKLNGFFKNFNIEYCSIRGNHSDPFYFHGNVNLSNFKLIPDYHFQEINGEKFLFVGGATSIDRFRRIEGYDYWEDEPFVLDYTKAKPCDILITHSAPYWLGPTDKNRIQFYLDHDYNLWEELQKEREGISALAEFCQPKRLFCGHFHVSERTSNIFATRNRCFGTILNILEFSNYYQPQ